MNRPKPPSRFVTDTLFKALGGAFPIAQKSRFLAPWKAGEQISGLTTLPDSVTLFGDQPDKTLMHEAGHVADARHLAPLTFAQAQTRMPEYENEDYFSKDPTEYVAEAFGRALGSSRKGFKDSTEVDKKMPGSIEFIRWLQTRPPFLKLASSLGAITNDSTAQRTAQ